MSPEEVDLRAKGDNILIHQKGYIQCTPLAGNTGGAKRDPQSKDHPTQSPMNLWRDSEAEDIKLEQRKH